jgi:DNA-binding GntR family transcriptional regulator
MDPVNDPSLHPINTSTLAEQASAVLREWIASGKLRGGERLVEAKIADRMQISRGPLREALKHLQAEGLVREEPRRGTFVAELTPEDVRDLYDLRGALEAQAARSVIEDGNTMALASLEKMLVAIGEAERSNDRDALASSDYAFHETLCRVSGNSRLLAVFVRHTIEMRVLLRVDDYWYLAPEGEMAEHAALVEAIRSGDPEQAGEAFREHAAWARQRILENWPPESPPEPSG